ncbi:hypothetical protein F52700_6606 [Fusarium sp. NRRL 52700]|nr:hypothetical protein F52700_6606 [Fusarium sp. NRRL 52700]
MSDPQDLATEMGSNVTAIGDSEQSGPRPGPQSGQPNLPVPGATYGSLMRARPRNSLGLSATQGAIGQLDSGIMNLNTEKLARSGIHMTMTTDLGGYRISSNNGDRTTLSKFVDAAYSVDGPGQSFSGVITVNNMKSIVESIAYHNSKRKRLTLDDDDYAKMEATRSTRRIREPAFLQLQDQGCLGQAGGRDQGRPHDRSQRRMFCVGCNCSAVNTDKERFIWFVKKRGGMPSFLDFNTWFLLASREGGLTVHDRFPWTAEFTKSFADDIKRLQNDLDAIGLEGEFRLPEDPKLSGWRAVKMYHQRRAKEGQKALDASQETVVLDEADTIDTANKADEMADEMAEKEIAQLAHTPSPTIDATAPWSGQEQPQPGLVEDPTTSSRSITFVGRDGVCINSNNAQQHGFISVPARSTPSGSVPVNQSEREALVSFGNIGGSQAIGFILPCGEALGEALGNVATYIGERLEAVPQQESPACGNCVSGRHLLAECLLPGPHGIVEGCSVHNNKDHNTDQCLEFINAGLSFKVHLLVTARGRLPPLTAGDEWYALVTEWNAQNPDDLIQMYRWTTELTRSFSSTCPAPPGSLR